MMVCKKGAHETEKGPLQCTDCYFQTEDPVTMKSHLNIIHKKNRIMKCADCQYFSQDKKEIRRHHKEAHAEVNISQKSQKLYPLPRGSFKFKNCISKIL